MKTTSKMVIEQLDRVINKILFLKKKSLFQFKGVKFFPSEIHLMLVIKEGTGTNATRIARELGVTKGAVSQTLSRLEKKGVLRKAKDPYKKNELTLTFTAFGARAFAHYSALAAEIGRKRQQALAGFAEAEKAAVRRFLLKVEGVLDEVE
jgi:DNA-binding MarR family transcriptional regulator